MRYRHLIQEERYQISVLLEAGFSQGAIAAKLSRSPSSVSRELSRNRLASSYLPQIAVALAKARRLPSAKMRAAFLLRLGALRNKSWLKPGAHNRSPAISAL